MKDFLKSTVFKVISGMVLIVSGIALYTASKPNDNILSNALNLTVMPMKKALLCISNTAFDFAYQFDEKEQLKRENEDLKNQINKLRDTMIDYNNVKRENLRFKKYYGIKDDDNSLKFVSASVIGRDQTDIFGDFIIDKGSNSGISVNDAVITENGFVGRICQINASTSRVKTILSPDAKIGVVDSSTGDSGIISGSAERVNENLTRMMYVSAHGDIKTDDIVVTSGISGMYPKNLKLGLIKSIEYDNYDSAHYAVIQPFENIKCVRDVFVITDFYGKGLMNILENDKN